MFVVVFPVFPRAFVGIDPDLVCLYLLHFIIFLFSRLFTYWVKGSCRCTESQLL